MLVRAVARQRDQPRRRDAELGADPARDLVAVDRRQADVDERDPFWHARFGARADHHGRQDGRFHLDYLAQSLAADDPGILEHYARWLQQVLTSRGMATHHLADNFRRLGAAIRDEAAADAAPAIAHLDAACAALRYPAGPARDIQDAAAALVAAASTAAPPAAAPPITAEASLAALVDHAADAVALGQPGGFARHVGWLAGFLEQHGTPRARLAAQLDALVAAAPTVVPAAAAALAEVLAAGLAAIRGDRG